MLKKSYKPNEIAKLFKNNDEEKRKFKAMLERKYGERLTKYNSINELIDWYFKDFSKNSWYKLYVYAKCKKNISEFTFKNNHYVKVTVFKHTTNLTYSTLHIGKYSKDYMTVEEAVKDYEACTQGDLIKLPKKVRGKTKEISKMFKTKDNFYGNYLKNGKEYCHGIFYYGASNLGICSIILSGDDDFSVKQDFYSYDEALTVWNILKNKEYVNKTDLTNSYFPN